LSSRSIPRSTASSSRDDTPNSDLVKICSVSLSYVRESLPWSSAKMLQPFQPCKIEGVVSHPTGAVQKKKSFGVQCVRCAEE
ncbi:hypothetical protein CEXT_129931, partial [Caerostris extrusa]